MFYELDGDLWFGRKYPMYVDGESTEPMLLLRNGIDDIVVAEDHPDVTKLDLEIVNYNHQLPIRIAAEHAEDPNLPAMIDAYREQAAIITKHDCVPIQGFNTLEGNESVNKDLKLTNAHGVWFSSIVEVDVDVETSDVIINIYLNGILFKDIVDPKGVVEPSNVEELLVHKLLYVDHEETEGEEPSTDEQQSPYLAFGVGINTKYQLDEYQASEDDDEAPMLEVVE